MLSDQELRRAVGRVISASIDHDFFAWRNAVRELERDAAPEQLGEAARQIAEHPAGVVPAKWKAPRRGERPPRREAPPAT